MNENNTNNENTKHSDGPKWDNLKIFLDWNEANKEKDFLKSQEENKDFDFKIKKLTYSGKDEFVIKKRKKLELLKKEQKEAEEKEKENQRLIKQNQKEHKKQRSEKRKHHTKKDFKQGDPPKS